MQALGIQLPRLPELDKEDIKAVRSFLPGKILGRTTALLSLVVLVLAFAGLVDQGLTAVGLMGLRTSPGLYFGFIIGLPLLAVVFQLVIEWRAERVRRELQRLAVQPGVDQTGYFRIGPYLDTPEDRARFDRADRAHEKVLNWIERSTAIPLYLTGDSGSGKSSLLNAFVLPALRDLGWTIMEARAWQDPETAIRDSLIRLGGTRRARQGNETQALLAATARAVEKRLLIVLDQFEEFLILGKPEQHEHFKTLVASLKSGSTEKVSLLLVLRSDYQMLLDELDLPPLRHGENFYQVGRFTLAAATRFMARSGLELHPETVDRLLISAAELDDTPGLVRPITLNVVGYVLATGRAMAMSADAGQLVHHYIELTCGQPAIRDFAPSVLEQLITDQGTKQPRSERELMGRTHLRRGEVRAVLNGLSEAALARPLDPTAGIWELSHDFVARAVTKYLGRGRHELVRKSAFYAAPALFLIVLLSTAGVLTWDRFISYETRTKLADLGLTATSGEEGMIIENNTLFTVEKLDAAIPLLTKQTLQSVDLSDTDIENLEPLKGLTSLRQLDVRGTRVANLEPLMGLTALQRLYLGKTQVANLEPLKNLTALQQLGLRGTQVTNLEPLKVLTALQSLDLGGTQVTNLEPLNGLTSLQQLDVRGTRVTNLEPLKGLIALQSLDLGGTQVTSLEPLKRLTSLRQLDIRGTRVAELEPLNGLTSLQQLYLGKALSH